MDTLTDDDAKNMGAISAMLATRTQDYRAIGNAGMARRFAAFSKTFEKARALLRGERPPCGNCVREDADRAADPSCAACSRNSRMTDNYTAKVAKEGAPHA